MAFFHKGQDLSYKCVDNVYLKIYCGLKDDRPDDALYERSGVMFLCYSATGFDICSLYKMKKSKRFLLRSKITNKSHNDSLLFHPLTNLFTSFQKSVVKIVNAVIDSSEKGVKRTNNQKNQCNLELILRSEIFLAQNFSPDYHQGY